ncbi:5-deoxy-glucuronate isomerase [Deinococcus metalli]|uniref:5-deoxy-glucuronate isomerase n=1 Tax=Deinococcus metalli TaxID=1141878 RepID=A0A7W8KEL5_9DEIO|nr:5-deoxy-glucuronate isomerase [Deinococcus metalli]MBB5375683.1 5-deoxy-glucuronate isomerase [Deinococcus metalli]GHF37807.1 5-deoxy-glucuronate isomerase [Deinococcus metalli]
MTSRDHLRPDAAGQVDLTPASAGWTHLSFGVVTLDGAAHDGHTGANEVAVVPQQGALHVTVRGATHDVSRRGVFEELPTVVYLPPGTAYRVEGTGTFAHGGAPATGTLPVRLVRPEDIQVEMRGGANATRQVSHVLGPDQAAERLLVYEVYTPSGNWSGWPPHRHDGQLSSLYIEETYHYRVQPAHGWAIHRNYSPEDGDDEALVARDGDVILSRRGYHPVAAAPGSNVYYLNFMAGEATGDARRTPPVDEPDWGWMRQDWGGRALALPIPVRAGQK